MLLVVCNVAIVRASITGACRTSATLSLPFCNTSLSFENRVADLVGRLDVSLHDEFYHHPT